jgi:hypothetical protein
MDRGVLDLELDEEEEEHRFMAVFPTMSLAILGPHPSKEVIFFVAGSSQVLMYDLVSSKVRYLGDLTWPNHRIEGVFPYRPCFVDALPLPRSVLNSFPSDLLPPFQNNLSSSLPSKKKV